MCSSDLEIYRTALGFAPDDPELHAQFSTWQSASGDLSGAVLSARRVTELLPHSVTAWAALGDALMRQEKFSEATSAYAKAIQRDPENYWARHNLARLHLKLNRREEFHAVVRAKETFVAVVTNQEFGRDIAKELQALRTVHEFTRVVRIMRADPQSKNTLSHCLRSAMRCTRGRPRPAPGTSLRRRIGTRRWRSSG